MLNDQQWQPVPGTAGAEIYPFLRKPDVTCSNAYLIRTPGEILLIDTGADPGQMNRIMALVDALLRETPRPVILIVTHCHADHCYQAIRDRRFRALPHLSVAAEETGARALEAGDAARTVAELMGWEIEPLPVSLPLLAARDRETLGADGGIALHRQQVPLRSGNTLLIYHTPGHSPDSICIRFGEYLFIGDLLFSTSPGIAGIAGWDQPALLASVGRVRWILAHEPVSLCCPGHGRSIPASAMPGLLDRLQGEAEKMAGVGIFDRERLADSLEHAVDLLQEANRVFAAIAGRLYALAYRLDDLGEAEEARRYQELLESDQIDGFLADFSRFADEFNAGEKFEVQLVLKAVQVIQRVEAHFAGDRLNHVVDASLLRRADRLLADFMNTILGYRDTAHLSAVDLPSVLRDLVAGALTCPFSDAAFIEAADDPAAYRAELVSRLAYLPLFEGVDLVLDGDDDPLSPVLIDRERFCDEVVGILEDMAAAGAREIRLSTRREGDAVGLLIRGSGTLSPRRLRFYRRKFGLCGASLAVTGDGSDLLLLLKPTFS
ncbi:MBL fold metallo-hydrolase [Methanoculleus oceani]|uniref:MBL fold metallo-hydrolase n=1 Tax=Methanoculleus oceani TaxID=2184756 RepID=A0ABD4TBB2_9EURY|nr:MBL fold metallo-hydrolase [Methanoculleus sp. CWC-02]MCM2465053.1 MBL fold metallo-hydrolase [Methanoculleus sp. CWC-02]